MIQREFDISIAREVNAGKRFGRLLTKSGHKVRLLAWDAKGLYPIAGLIDRGGFEQSGLWTNDGRADFRPNVHTSNDLIIEVEGGEA